MSMLQTTRFKRYTGNGPLLPLTFTLARQGHPQRKAIEQFITGCYQRAYNAQIDQFYPQLLALELEGELTAAVGIRSAEEEPLFVQQYLDSRVEQAVADLQQQPVDRGRIAEIGNLAVARPGASQVLFIFLGLWLVSKEYQWIVCNAVPAVQAVFNRLDVRTIPLAPADKHRLQNGYSKWGRYYDQPSTIMVAPVAENISRMINNPAFEKLAEHLRPHLTTLTPQ